MARHGSRCQAFLPLVPSLPTIQGLPTYALSLAPLEMPDFRFTALHLDIVGPLPESEGHSYLLTVIDRFSRWLEAIPLVDITAKTCATALLRHWVARYGVPASIVTDRGRQFTSELWAELAQVLGISRRQTTSYHPQRLSGSIVS